MKIVNRLFWGEEGFSPFSEFHLNNKPHSRVHPHPFLVTYFLIHWFQFSLILLIVGKNRVSVDHRHLNNVCGYRLPEGRPAFFLRFLRIGLNKAKYGGGWLTTQDPAH